MQPDIPVLLFLLRVFAIFRRVMLPVAISHEIWGNGRRALFCVLYVSQWFGEESGQNRMVRDSDRRPNITISCDFRLIG